MFPPEAITIDWPNYCVYGIYYGDNLVYIGSGNLARAFFSRNEKRSMHPIKIIPTKTREEAYALEAELIERIKPKLNTFIPKANGRPARKIKR